MLPVVQLSSLKLCKIIRMKYGRFDALKRRARLGGKVLPMPFNGRGEGYSRHTSLDALAMECALEFERHGMAWKAACAMVKEGCLAEFGVLPPSADYFIGKIFTTAEGSRFVRGTAAQIAPLLTGETVAVILNVSTVAQTLAVKLRGVA